MNGNFYDEKTGLDIYYTTVGTAHILYADVSELCIDKVRDMLSEFRILKVNAIRRDIDKKLSAGAEILLSTALSRYYPQIKTPLEYEFGKFKKPGFAGFADIHFNLSHAGNVAVCAVAQTEVGVDIELISRMSEGVINKYFTDAEKQMLSSGSCFSYIWTRKEAVSKAEGTGLSLGLGSFSVDSDMVCINSDTYSVTSITPEIPGYELALSQRLVAGNTP